MPVRIAGIGSWCGDDRIGWDAVEAVETSGLLRRFPEGSVTAHRCERPSELLALAKGAAALVVIDAMRSGAPPGTVRRLAPDEPLGGQETLSSHGLGVAECLALGRTLGLLPPLLLYGIEAPRSAPDTAPDELVSAAIPALLRLLAADLAGAGEGAS